MRVVQWLFFAIGLFNGGIAIGVLIAWAMGAVPMFPWLTIAMFHAFGCAVLLRRS